MRRPYFFAGRESELRELVDHPDHKDLHCQLRRAACRGMDPGAFHPDEGQPDELVIARCQGCEARLACLALALRAEGPDMRSGWYGGLGPGDRDNVAAILKIMTSEVPVPDRAARSAQLRAAGWTINDIAAELGCSRRTIQRYLRAAAA